ncbi:hypothetical protein T11_4693 [Trichinella zimbabwensis]|uniref:Uncharacterized protein n=1 Tax=Trichinella zimbabwensis TaxID=268475 RepID=A0A0V1GTI9_9BILA|nr:hypothetical protein T11_4693 [Trichinella zimbabwensis]
MQSVNHSCAAVASRDCFPQQESIPRLIGLSLQAVFSAMTLTEADKAELQSHYPIANLVN